MSVFIPLSAASECRLLTLVDAPADAACLLLYRCLVMYDYKLVMLAFSSYNERYVLFSWARNATNTVSLLSVIPQSPSAELLASVTSLVSSR